ncbi:hypothetical protein D3C71_1839810 [compost metagenome]
MRYLNGSGHVPPSILAFGNDGYAAWPRSSTAPLAINVATRVLCGAVIRHDDMRVHRGKRCVKLAVSPTLGQAGAASQDIGQRWRLIEDAANCNRCIGSGYCRHSPTARLRRYDEGAMP